MAKPAESQQAILEMGTKTDFWKLICEFVDKSIAIVERERDSEELMDLPADQYKFAMELIKTKIKYLKRIKEYPDIIITSLEKVDSEEEDFDPFEK